MLGIEQPPGLRSSGAKMLRCLMGVLPADGTLAARLMVGISARPDVSLLLGYCSFTPSDRGLAPSFTRHWPTAALTRAFPGGPPQCPAAPNGGTRDRPASLVGSCAGGG